MAFTASTDAFEVYRGLEEKIKDEIQTPIVNGRVYFAYDSDKLFYDANNVRHEISGGGNVAFITSNSAPTYEGDTGYYTFRRVDIESKKLGIDNIILAVDNSIYRVMIIDDEQGIVKTQQIAGGGGGGGVTNPLTITTITNFPDRTIDTQDVSCTVKINSIITTDETCVLQVKVNGQEVSTLGSLNAPLRTDITLTIPHRYYNITDRNEIEIIAEVDENTKSKKLYFYAFHSEFTITSFNPRQPFGTDNDPGVSQAMVIGYSFTGLTDIKGHIHMFIDEEELYNLADENSDTVKRYGGGPIYSGNGNLNIPCTLEEFGGIEHGSHTLRLDAYAVVNDEEFFVDSAEYDIIWATEEGGISPIIISNYTNTQEENYNIINIQYVVYAKNQENVTVHQYVNGDELPTSPITITYDKSLNTWKTWAISKYVPNAVNTFRLMATVEGKVANKEWQVEITPSDLLLDAKSDNLLLYLSALDRSNDELAMSRQTWKYTNYNNQTYAARFNNFTWNNDGWQLDSNSDSVLRLNNGASVEIPFTGIMQEDKPDPGFTIEVEFRCRNATSFAKLMTYTSLSIQATDEFGNPLYEQEPMLDSEGNPIEVISVDTDGNQIQKVDSSNHLAFKYGDITLYLHEDSQGGRTYFTDDGLYADENGDPIVPATTELEPIWVYETVMQDKLDENGNKIPIMVDDGAVEKRINYNKEDGTVANAVGSFFASQVGFCIGTQEAFFASTGKKVNVRYADDDKVKVSVVVDSKTNLLYIYINAVLSGVERFGDADSFKAQGVTGLTFNSNYCDLDIYTIRIYNTPLDFDGIVQNWIGDAPNLATKRQRYLENHITKTDSRNGYVTLDYELTKELSRKMAQNYKEQVALGNYDAQKGLPILVISTYPTILSNDTKSDLLPYNKAIKQYVDMRFWDPNYDEVAAKNYGIQGFKVQDFELSVQGTSSQGYPRRNYKAKIKATKSDVNGYADAFPFYFTTWDGDDEKKDIWPVIGEDATDEDVTAAWQNYSDQTGGYEQLSKIDIGNGTKETKFCFKADYMDSSSTHNTSLADYIDVLSIRDKNNTYNLIHPMKRLEGQGSKKYRTTVFGFPMLVFWDHKGQSTAPEFVGRYNFNTDKSATGSFGFDLNLPHNVLKDVTYITPEVNAKGKTVKDDYDNLNPVEKVGTPLYKEICECWELTSNQHGFTGFRRNDWDALDADGHLDFYNFWENRYSIMDFDPDAVYKGDSTPNKTEAIRKLTLYAKNIMDLSKWIYSTDVHPWDTDDETSASHHKLTQVHNATEIRYTVDDETGNITLLSDYYTYDTENPNVVAKVEADRFAVVNGAIQVYYDNTKVQEMPWTLLYADEINRVLDTPVFYGTRDEAVDVVWTAESDTPTINKTYYSAPDDEHAIPDSWYRKSEILVDANDGTNRKIVAGYTTIIRDDNGKEYKLNEIYEKYTRDTKEYRLSKYHAEFDKHLNFDYCAFYFILTEFFILYDSREKNMMIATWGPETEGGDYIWYPIFYDMDTQLGINNSGTVYWDYDVNAQDDGLFSGAGSVLWDNFYACFLDRIKQVYRAMRDNNFRLEDCIKYYNTDSADRWSPIIKNVDAFYKYVAPSIDADGLRYTTKQGTQATTSSYFYCAQGDRTLNRAAFFRNRFNYKDSEWLGGSYRTQGGANIEMRYDANWTDTSDPDASNWTTEEAKTQRAALQSNATFDIKPYLTQYCSVYYDEIPREGGRFDIQQEPVIDPETGRPDTATLVKYAKNITNIEKTGYVTVHPLEAIQNTIDSGMPLSQQLVYIYGPEYLRDIGDLSLKYLDRFFCQDAIRLNSLIVGNDNPYYMNTGLVDDAFKLDTAYLTPTGTLNPNAKALLSYLDISNLGGLTQDIDVSGCLKIKTIKALGTKCPTITVPNGNVIESLYLPATTNTFVHIKSQRLSNVIREKNRAISYYTNPPDVGLYIENITDRMNISRDTDLITKYVANSSEATKKQNIQSNITSDPNYNNPAAPYYVGMKRFHIEGGVLGFQSYEMLDYIIKQKIKMRYDTALENDTRYDRQLALRLLDVNWSPYTKIDIQAPDDRTYTDNEYFIRNDDLTYSPLGDDVTFEYANTNLGGVYQKTANRLAANGRESNDTLEGIPNLDLLKMFISDYDNPDRTVTNQQNLYMVIDTALSGKNLPHIGGEIYLDNDTAVNEYELYTIAQRYSAVLGVDDTPLTICAKTVTACPRAKFVEITADGQQKTIAMYRSNDASADVTLPIDLIRNDYDFRGWASEDAIQTYEPNFLKKNDSGVIVSNTNGVVENNSELLKHLAVTIDQTTSAHERIFEDGAEALVFGSTPVTYYAVFTLHKYEVRYVLDKDAYDASEGADESSYELVLVPSNAYIDAYPPTHIPYFRNDTLPIGQMHQFLGWGISTDLRPRSLHYAIRKDQVFYPFYQIVNAYNTPLGADYFDYVTVGGKAIIYGLKRAVGGRICIPKTLGGSPVGSIIGTNWNLMEDKYTPSVISGTTTRTKAEGNGFQSNNELTQIYFEGANNNTSTIEKIDVYSFYRAYNLEYIDLPNTLTAVGNYAFTHCSKLSFSTLNALTVIGNNAFQFTNTYGWNASDSIYEYERHVDTLYIGKDVNPGSGAFASTGYNTIIIGSESAPSERQQAYNRPFGGAASMYTSTYPGGYPISGGGLKTLRIYHTTWGPSSQQVSIDRLMLDNQYTEAAIEVYTIN